MLWHTGKIVCKNICTNTLIDDVANTYDSIKLSEILHINVALDAVKKTFESH